MARIHFIKEDGFNRYKVPLSGGTPFVLYYEWVGTGRFYPVTFYGGTSDTREDFAFRTEAGVSAASVLQLRFNTTATELTEGNLDSQPLQYRNGRTGDWLRPRQRKGEDYCIAGSTGSWDMRSIKRAHIYDDQIRFSLRMDIVSKGDSWISYDALSNNVIRMRDVEGRRSRLIALRRGDVANDATGGLDVSYHSRSYDELTEGLILATQEIDLTSQENTAE
ncbi:MULTISPECIES: hypothetical protein [Streptomyces]|uniref:Uncharacterized protein n=1 Tax=Streptomyces kasugaensis TaxID=1946 RepID=A0A4Q9HST3_STRKA|nr:hypothetical protein [Streptomyces kasugaensis]TBO58086.1 hypothetical protein EYS09_19310 [Streptomyces kasugaensis]